MDAVSERVADKDTMLISKLAQMCESAGSEAFLRPLSHGRDAYPDQWASCINVGS